MTRAAGLKSKAAEVFRRRSRPKMEVWVVAKGSEEKKGDRVDPPGQAAGQAAELRAPVGVRDEEVEAVWALLTGTSSAARSASPPAARVSSVGRGSSRRSSGASAKSGSGSRSLSRSSSRWVSISQDSRLISSSSSREVSRASSRCEGSSRLASEKSASSAFRRRGDSSRSRPRQSSGSFQGSPEGARTSFFRAPSRSFGPGRRSRGVIKTSPCRAVSRLVNGVVEDVERSMILERLVKAERFGVKMKIKAEEVDKFGFKSESGCKKQFRFNLRLKNEFVGELKSELEDFFGKVPEKIGSLIEEAEKVIDDRNLKLKIGEEFGMAAMEEFGEEDLARNEGERKKLKVFRKEREALGLEVGGSSRGKSFKRGLGRSSDR